MIWILPSTISLILKSFLLFYSVSHKKKEIFTFIGATILLNICELLLFVRLNQDLAVLKLYYCAAIFTTFCLMLTCSNISKSCQWIKSDFFLLIVGILAASIFFSDYIIMDFNVLPDNTLTRVSGPYYFVFQLYMILAIIFSIVVLIKKLLIKADYLLTAQCLVALLAFTPPIIMIMIITALMQLGYRTNAVVLLSISLCFMSAMFATLNDKHKLFTIMSFIPFSHERIYRLKLKQLLKQIQSPIYGKSVNMKELLKEFELLIIENTQYYFATQKEVAQLLDISEGSLSRKKAQKK